MYFRVKKGAHVYQVGPGPVGLLGSNTHLRAGSTRGPATPGLLDPKGHPDRECCTGWTWPVNRSLILPRQGSSAEAQCRG